MNARKAVDREWNETIKPMLRSLNVGSYRYSGLPAYTGFSFFGGPTSSATRGSCDAQDVGRCGGRCDLFHPAGESSIDGRTARPQALWVADTQESVVSASR